MYVIALTGNQTRSGRRKQAERERISQKGGKGSMSLICNHLYLMNKTASEPVVCICKLPGMIK